MTASKAQDDQGLQPADKAPPDREALLQQISALTPAELAAMSPEQREQIEQLRARLTRPSVTAAELSKRSGSCICVLGIVCAVLAVVVALLGAAIMHHRASESAAEYARTMDMGEDTEDDDDAEPSIRNEAPGAFTEQELHSTEHHRPTMRPDAVVCCAGAAVRARCGRRARGDDQA
jgi:hypothetical protein